MGFHVCAFRSASLADGVEGALTPIEDNVLDIRDGGFYTMDNMEYIGGISQCASVNFAKVVQSSLLCFGYSYEVASSGVVAGSTGNINTPLRDDRPLTIKGTESLKFTGSQTSGGALAFTQVALLRDTYENAPPGDLITFRGTSTTAGVANTWTALTTTWQEDLPAGRYAVVGGRLEGAAGYCWRLRAHDCRLRPGAFTVADAEQTQNPKFRYGRLGKWCDFLNTVLPTVEVLGSTTTAVWTTYLDLVRMS